MYADVESRVPPEAPATPDLPPSGIDPADLEATLMLDGMAVSTRPTDFVAVRQATAAMFKAVKKVRRREIRRDRSGGPRRRRSNGNRADRIDDETRGIPIATMTTAPTAGTLLKPRACYICKQPYTVVDAFLDHQLCPTRAAMSHAKRDARTHPESAHCSPAVAPRSACTSRCDFCAHGAHTTITTRIRDAVRRFSSLRTHPTGSTA